VHINASSLSLRHGTARVHDRMRPRLRAVAAGVLITLTHGLAAAQIYAGESGGAVVLSNFRSEEASVLLIGEPATDATSPTRPRKAEGGTAARTAMLRLPVATPELTSLIAEVAARVQIPPELLHAVIAAESRYNSRAVSAKGAIGLMQLLPATAQRFGARDPFVARQNIEAGAGYLKWLMALFRDDMELVLAAYNAGEQAVIRAGGRIPNYPETQAYVPRVLAYLRCARSSECRGV
jgi:soluble lytic murein transglycosylase-like protein